VGYTSPTTTATYAYNALDRRIAKTVDGVVEQHVHDQANLRSIVSNDIVLEFRDLELSRRSLFGSRVDDPIAFEGYPPGSTSAGSGNQYGVFLDRQGSVTHVVEEATGTLVETRRYDAFGNAFNRRDLILDGAVSKRAMRQIATMGGPTKFGHVVLIKTPGGLMSRAQALIMEKMMVTMLANIGMQVNPGVHTLPREGGPDWCPV